MRRTLFFVMLFAATFGLSTCNTAGPHFRGLAATTVTVDGSTFDVRVRGELAEAIRTNRQYAPRFGPIRERAGRAMARVSGCEVREVRGDQAQATGVLKCPKAVMRVSRSAIVNFECMPLRGTQRPEIGGTSVEIECEPAL